MPRGKNVPSDDHIKGVPTGVDPKVYWETFGKAAAEKRSELLNETKEKEEDKTTE